MAAVVEFGRAESIRKFSFGLTGPRAAWLKQLAKDTGERFLFDYFRNRWMSTEQRASAADADDAARGVVQRQRVVEH